MNLSSRIKIYDNMQPTPNVSYRLRLIHNKTASPSQTISLTSQTVQGKCSPVMKIIYLNSKTKFAGAREEHQAVTWYRLLVADVSLCKTLDPKTAIVQQVHVLHSCGRHLVNVREWLSHHYQAFCVPLPRPQRNAMLPVLPSLVRMEKKHTQFNHIYLHHLLNVLSTLFITLH